MLWTLPAYIALVGFIYWVGSKLQRRLFSGTRTDPQGQETLPSSIFSPSSNSILVGQEGPDQLNVLSSDGVVGSVSRSTHPLLSTRVSVSVPQTIWQSAGSREDTPDFKTDLFNVWTTKNPGYDHYFLDDQDVEAFVAAHYNDTVLQSFRKLPIDVMRADVFRYVNPYANCCDDGKRHRRQCACTNTVTKDIQTGTCLPAEGDSLQNS